MIVRVYCPDCTDGTAPDGFGCVMCSAMGHIAIDRLPNGDIPQGYTEWKDRELGPIVLNPLTLRTDAPR